MSDVQTYVVQCKDKGLERAIRYLYENDLLRDPRSIGVDERILGAMHHDYNVVDSAELLDAMHVFTSQSLPLILNGTGTYHHFTYAFCRKIVDRFGKPYTVIHFDHHSDGSTVRYKFKGLINSDITCGNYYSRLMADSNYAKSVIWIQAPATMISVNRKGKVIESSDAHLWATKTNYRDFALKESVGEAIERTLPVTLAKTLENIETDLLYVTVDLDVLSKEHLDTDWDQGDMHLNFLLRFLEGLGEKRKIIGADICGLRKDDRFDLNSLATFSKVYYTLYSAMS